MAENIGLEGKLDLTQWERGVETYTNSIDRMSSKSADFIRVAGDEYAKLGGAIAGVGAAALGAATAVAGMTGKAIVDWTQDSVGKATDFESAFTGVIKTVDGTDEELDMLRAGILAMTKDLPAGADSIASVAEAAGQLGIKVPNILGFTRVMSDLGVATNMSSEEAATALARFANITGMSQTDFDRLGSSIVALGNNLATTEDEIVTMALRIAGAGTQVGMSESQILALAGSLSSVGIQAEAGGSAISRVMIDMASAVANGGDELEGFASVAGMSAGEFAAAFQKDAADAILAFIGGLDGISKSGGNVFGVLEELGLGEIRVRDALLRSSSATHLFRDAMDLSNRAWEENNALTKEAELRYGTMESKSQLLSNAMERIQIGVGDKFIPLVRDMTDVFIELLDNNADRIVGFFGQVAEWAGKLAEKLVPLVQQWLPGLLDGVERFGNAFARFVDGILTHGFEVWEDGSGTVMDFLMVLGMSEDAAQDVGQRFYDLATAVLEFADWVRDAIAPVTDFIAELVEWEDVAIAAGLAVAAFLAPLGLAIAKMTAVGAAATLAVALIRDAWEDNLGGVRDFVAEVWDQIQVIVATSIRIVQELFERHGGDLGDIASTAWEWIKSFIFQTLQTIQSIQLAVLAAIQGDWETAWIWVKNAVLPIWHSIQDAWNAALGALTQFLADHWPTWSARLSEWARAAWEWITQTAIPVALEKLGEWGSALWQWVTDNAPAWAERLDKWAAAAWEWIVDVTPTVVGKLAEWGGALWNWLSENLPAWAERLGEWATAAWQWITETALPVALEKLTEWGGALWNWLSDNLPTWLERLGEWAAAAWQWIVDATAEVPSHLSDWYIAISTWLGENLPFFVTKLGEWASAAWQWVIDAAAQIPEKLLEWWTVVQTWLDENLPKLQEDLKDWTQALIDWVTNASGEDGTKKALTDWHAEISGWFATRFIDFEVGLVQWTTGLVEWIGNAVPGAITAIADFVTGFVAWMVGEGSEQGLGKIGEGLNAWIQAFIDWVSGPEGLITRLVPEWQKLGASIIDAIINIATAIQDAKDRINAAYIIALAFVGTAIIDGIKSGIDAASGGLLTKISNVGTAIVNAANEALDSHSPSREFEKVGLHAMEGLEKGIVNNMRLALEAATTLTVQFLEKFDVILSKLPLVAKDSMSEFIKMFREGMETALGLAGERTVEFLQKFNVILTDLPRFVQEAMAEFVLRLRDGLDETNALAEHRVAEFLALFDVLPVDLPLLMQETMVDFLDSLRDGFDETVALAEQRVADFLAQFDIIPEDLPALIQETMEEFLNHLREGFDETVSLAEQRVADFLAEFDIVPEALPTLIQETMKKFLDSLRDGFDETVALAEQRVADFLAEFDSIPADLPALIEETMKKFLDSLRAGFDETVTLTQTRVAEFLAKFDVMVERLPAVAREAVNGFISALQTGYQQVLSESESFSQRLGGILDGVATSTRDKLTAAGNNAGQGFANGLNAQIGAVQAAAAAVANSVPSTVQGLLAIASPSREMEEIGENTVKGFEGGIVNSTRLALDAAGTLTLDFLQKFDIILSKLPLVAKDSMSQFVQMFRNGMDAALSTASARALEFLDRFQIIIVQLPQKASQAMTQFTSAIQQGLARVLAEAQAFIPRLLGVFDNMASQTSSRFMTAGQQAGQGFVNGLNSKIGEVQAKATQLANIAAQALAASLQARSPSRTFMIRGEWAGEGFVEGMDRTLDAVRQKAMELGETALMFSAPAGGTGFYGMAAQQLAAQPAPTTYQSYATNTSVIHNWNNQINTPMDLAEWEFRMRRVVADTF